MEIVGFWSGDGAKNPYESILGCKENQRTSRTPLTSSF